MTLGGLGVLSYVLIFIWNDMFSPIFTALMPSSAWNLGSSAAVDERLNEAATAYFKELGTINNQK
jgi:hypothetical protein